MFYKNQNQMLRVDGRNVFLEVLNNGFEIGKLMFQFIQYDDSKAKNNRVQKCLAFYLDFADALLLAQDILSGRLSKLGQRAKEKQKEGGYKYCSPIYQKLGGISAEKLKERGQSRPDGKSLSRQFKITPGAKMPWVFSIEQGAGNTDKNGLIVPEKGGVEEYVRVPFTDDDLKKFAIMIDKHITAYMSGYYARHGKYQEPKKY